MGAAHVALGSGNFLSRYSHSSLPQCWDVAGSR
jgi:hypothetical protein